MLAAALLLLVAGPSAPAAPVAAPTTQEPDDPVARLQRWTRSWRRTRSELAPDELIGFEQHLADTRMLAVAVPARRREVTLALLDLAAARPAGPAFAAELPTAMDGQAARVREDALAVVRALLSTEEDPDLGAWLGSDVLARRDSRPLELRIAAAEGLRGLHLASTRLALLGCALEGERSLREAAMLALEGWPDDVVHRFLLDQLARNGREPGWISPRIVRRHFGAVRIAAQSPAATALAAHLRAALAGSDWRAAFRAVQLAPAIPDELAMPVLLDALDDWGARRARGEGRLRLEGDLLAELQRRSGRRIGLHPERWRSWWTTRQAARERDEPDPDPSQTTRADFFGLRPLTDRVVFVLDRSSSMEHAFAGSTRSSYDEALEQLMKLLGGLGEGTRFRIVLFSDGNLVWSDRLKPATSLNLAAARAWMSKHRPRGGTHLEPGVAEALRLDGRGRVDLERLEADTVIVLCDGETATGPGWVRPLLEGPNEEACVVFHSVQIGAGGDGTLEALASGSGGEFVRVLP